jgi:hypothetical protein
MRSAEGRHACQAQPRKVCRMFGFTTQYVQHRFSGCGYNGKPILGRTMLHYARKKTVHVQFECHANSRRNTLGKHNLEKVFRMFGFTTQYVQHRFSCCGYTGKPILGRTMLQYARKKTVDIQVQEKHAWQAQS